MPFIHPSERSRLIEFLRALAPSENLERGLALAHAEAVTECSFASNEVHGSVRRALSDRSSEAKESDVSVALAITSPRRIEASCSCESVTIGTEPAPRKPRDEGVWCPHAVALLWRAHELGFLSEDHGFDSQFSNAPRIGSLAASAGDFAAVVRELSARTLSESPDADYMPEVSISLDLSSDRLGVQVSFDNAVQEPSVFDGFRKRSSRALDELLIRILDDEGVWDDASRLWYVNSSEGISLVLGLLHEYQKVTLIGKRKQITVSQRALNAQLMIRWIAAGAELSMRWVLEDKGSTAPPDLAPVNGVFGNGPYWTLVDSTIFKLSSEAANIHALFPHGPSQALARAQLAPLLEVISAGLHRSDFVTIENPDLQPIGEPQQPETTLRVSRGEIMVMSDRDSQPPSIVGELDFTYPEPDTARNTVVLPDRGYEKDCHDALLMLGFRFDASQRRYSCTNDPALDLISKGRTGFPADWKVEGIETLKRGLRFTDSKISVVLSEGNPDGSIQDPVSDKKGAKKAASRGSKSAPAAKIDWFDCHVSLVLNNSNVPLSTLFKSSSSDDDRWLRLDSGAYTKVPGGSVRQLKGILGMLDPNYRLSNSIRSRLSAPVAVGLSRSPGTDFSVSCSPALLELAKRLEEFSGITTVKVPSSFKGKLRPYQQQGVNWLGFLCDYKLAGILADEMGLGKTVQTLAFLLSRGNTLKARSKASPHTFKKKPTLIVAPTSVIMNWFYEAQKFTPGLKCLVLHGPKRRALFAKLSEYDIVITSYALLRIDRLELERQQFDYLVLDEAQHIKNFQAATTSAAKGLNAEHRLALSGTPTENRPLELWSIFDFLMPGYLGTHDFFRAHIERPILDQGGSVDVAQMLRGKTRPFVLRRTKAEVERDLPPKIESVLHVEMTESQRDLYNHILEEVRPRVMEAVAQKGIAGASVSILAALLRLRQVCNHPNSIDALKDLPGYDSGKFSLFQEVLEEALDNGRKILVFAQFREMLKIIRRHLDEKSVKYCYLDGATKDRQSAIEQFSNDEKVRVFLISLKAGGLGLNLTAADTVVIYDPWWNPAVESQAVDRAHRIGQRKTVHVYRLVTEDSVEQKIMALKAKKTAIVDALVNDNGLSAAALTKVDIESLFAPLV